MNAKKVGTKETSEVTYKDTRIATNSFTMHGTAKIICWGDSAISTITMDTAYFESDELSNEDIFNNINDGQFGCERIVGARDIHISQIYNTTRQMRNGDIIEFEEEEVVLEFGEIKKLANGSIVLTED